MKYLTIIEPVEDIMYAEECQCRIMYLTGDKKGSQEYATLGTGIFRYYYYGATIEVVGVEDGYITEVRDIKAEDIPVFELGLSYALTFNSMTKELLATNGFVYKFDQSTFCRRFPNVVSNMYQAMTLQPFVWHLYILNGAIVYVEMLTNFSSDSPAAKYALHCGFVAGNRDTLKCMLPKTAAEFQDATKILSQEEIDRLFLLYKEGN